MRYNNIKAIYHFTAKGCILILQPNRQNFQALLKSEAGELLASGLASVQVKERAVTFKSDFVPLYPLGTPMQVVRLQDDQEIHLFSGKVYLSAKRLMKLVSVSDDLLPGSERYYTQRMHFSATAIPLIPAEPVRERRLFSRRLKIVSPVPTNISVQITQLNTQTVTVQFEAPETPRAPEGARTTTAEELTLPFTKGMRFRLLADTPLPLNEATIEIVKSFYFGARPFYECAFISLTAIERSVLKDFLWQYNLKHNKLF